jgi:DNA helicase-2/ATP-dependent DNA helicase PcrA
MGVVPARFPSTVDMRPVLDRLTDEQRVAVTTPGPVCVIAGAGTGKTSTMCARVAYAVATGRATPDRILAVTHSRRAAGEMRDRILTLGVTGPVVRTFHAAAWAQLRTVDGRPPTLLDSPHRIVRDLLGAYAKRPDGRGGSEDVVADLVSEIAWAQTALLRPDDYPTAAVRHHRQPPLPAEQVTAVWERYETVKRSLGVEDFGDILLRAAATAFPGSWDLVLVDEYQDTDAAQDQLFDHWLGGTAEPSVVGDPRQAIYGFKGASAEFLHGFADKHGAAVVHLTRNFRSSDPICMAANRLQPSLPPLVGGGDGPAIALRRAADEPAEEAAVVTAMRDWHRSGVPWEEMAVLARFRSTTVRFESALAAASIPFNTGADERFFAQPDVLAVCRDFGQRARRHPDDAGVELLRDAAADAGWVRDDPPAGEGARRRRWELHNALVNLVERIAGIEQLSAAWLLGELQHRAREAHVPAAGGVSVLTAHGAKGLEWDAVAVVGATDGAFPSTYATTVAEQAEERNLFYVAITRARRHCLVTWPATRHNRPMEPSPYLAVVEPTTATVRRRGATTQPSIVASFGAVAVTRRSCGTCGARLVGAGAALGRCVDHLEGPVAALASAVRDWRAREAKRLGIAEARVCSDTAVLALCAQRPATVDALAGIPRLERRGTDLEALALVFRPSNGLAARRQPDPGGTG